MSSFGNLWNFVGRHKYFITLLLFGVIIVFLDDNSFVQRSKHQKEIDMLNSEIARYRRQFEEDSEKLKELDSNPEALEKIAREKYLMKKHNEDVFIFDE